MNQQWAEFLGFVAVGKKDQMTTWSSLADSFGVRVTRDLDEAERFCCEGVEPAQAFPPDRQWIWTINRFVADVNTRLQEWRKNGGTFLGHLHAVTDLITPLSETPGLSLCQQIDFIERFATPDLPLQHLRVCEG
jgi:hypothetical protein